MFQPEIKMSEPVTVAFIHKQGSYEQIPEGYGQLYGWIAQHGLIPARDGAPMAVYLTDPAEASEAEAVWELWAPLAGNPASTEPDADGLGVKDIEPAWVASAMHHGPYESIEPTYDKLMDWIEAQGYRISGPYVEIYYSDPDETPPEEYLTEVRFPVEKR